MQEVITAKVQARLPGGSCNLNPVPADPSMTQPVGRDEDGRLWAEAAKYNLHATGDGATIKITLKSLQTETQNSPAEE